MTEGRTIQIKRIYAPPSDTDGLRVLIDRLWPRGVSKPSAAVDHWAKGLAPSTGLRKWFHGGGDFTEFSERYRAELQQPEPSEALEQVRTLWEERGGVLTLLYGSRDELHNHAVLLKAHLEETAGDSV